MTCGEKIVQLRKANGMTQEELGKILSVTYQAVSKWERGESSPDFTTISQIAKLFNVPISYFEENGEIERTEELAPTDSVNNNYVGTCTVCGKMLKEDDEYTANPKIVCKSCAELEEKRKQEERARGERQRAYAAAKARKAQLGRSIDVKLIISLVLALICYVGLTVAAFIDTENDEFFYGFLACLVPLAVFAIAHAIGGFITDLLDKDDDTDGYTRNLSLITAGGFAIVNVIVSLVMYLSFEKRGYFLAILFVGAVIAFTFVSQYMWGGVIREIFTCGGFTFKLPGVIFSLSVESIIMMIVIKIFLGIVAAIIFILTSIFFAVVAILGSVFTFIPSVISKTAKDKKA